MGRLAILTLKGHGRGRTLKGRERTAFRPFHPRAWRPYGPPWSTGAAWLRTGAPGYRAAVGVATCGCLRLLWQGSDEQARYCAGRAMRIVHGASNIAGLPIEISRAQRALGHRSMAVLYRTARGAAPGSVDMELLLQGNRPRRIWGRGRLLAHLLASYDVFHFHFHTSYLPLQRDLPLWRVAGKRIIFHLHGCDIRDPRRVRVEQPVSACAECPVHCMVPTKLHLPDAIVLYADRVIVSTPDLLEFVPGADYIPNPLDSAALPRPSLARRASGQEYVVVHAPTDRAIKGTRHLEAAIEQLRAEGVPVRLQLLEGLPREQMLRACLEADVAVDQLLIGWFGLFALEMMALGKPVIAYIRPGLERYAPGLPVVSAEPATIAATLRVLLLDAARRERLAADGPAYVAREHNPIDINCRILALYAAVGARR